MMTHLGFFLLVIGCMCESQASAADTPVSLVRAQRAESNAAIAAHDAARLRKLFERANCGFCRAEPVDDARLKIRRELW